MKKLFLFLCLVSSTFLKADVQEDLIALATQLKALTEKLKVAQPVIKPIITQPAPQNVLRISTPVISGQVANKQLADLLHETQKKFLELAADANKFMNILDNFIKFTEGTVNPIAESAQLNDLATMLKQNLIEGEVYRLKDWIEKINQSVSEASSHDAKIIQGFLQDILDEINKFVGYVNKVYYEHEKAWDRITFVYKYPTEGYSQEAPASYHFYNMVLTRRAIERLDRMREDLERTVPRWKRIAEAKIQGPGAAVPTGGTGEQQGPRQPEGGAKPTFSVPALEIKLADITPQLIDFNLVDKALPFSQAVGDLEGYMHAVEEQTKEFYTKLGGAINQTQQLPVFNRLVTAVEGLKNSTAQFESELDKFNGLQEEFSQKDAKEAVAFLKVIQNNINNFYNWIKAITDNNFNKLQQIRFMYKNKVMTENAPTGDKFLEFVFTPIEKIMKRGTERNAATKLNDAIMDWEEKVNPSAAPVGGEGYQKQLHPWLND